MKSMLTPSKYGLGEGFEVKARVLVIASRGNRVSSMKTDELHVKTTSNKTTQVVYGNVLLVVVC
jgi:hypothetical protein